MKFLTLIKSLIGGATKPLPLSGIVKEIKEARKNKITANVVIKIIAYAVVGVVIWLIAINKIGETFGMELIKLLF